MPSWGSGAWCDVSVIKIVWAALWRRAWGRVCWRKGSSGSAVAGIQERDAGGLGVACSSERWREVNGTERYMGGRISKTLPQDFSG